MDNYQSRRTWSDSHLATVKAALGKKFFAVSSLEQDCKQGIDLFIPELKLAVRVRQWKYQRYNDFTLRSSGGGDRPEYEKLLDPLSKVDFLLYAYALNSKDLVAGFLIDLPAWRHSVTMEEVEPVSRTNKDGSTFVAFPMHPSYTEQII